MEVVACSLCPLVPPGSHAIALAKIIKPIKDLVALQVAEW